MSIDIFGNSQNYSHVKSTEEKDYLYPIERTTSGDDNEFIDDEPVKRPVYFFSFILFFGLLTLGFQLARIQIANYSHYQSLASGNSIRVLIVPPNRGLILDQKLNPLVRNVNKHALAVNLAELPRNSKDRDKLFASVEPFLHLSEDEKNQIKKSLITGSGQLVLRTNINRDEMLLLKEKLAKIPSFTVIEKPIRQYNTVSGLGQLLGYLGRVGEEEVKSGDFLPTEEIGRLGLEKVYDADLRGKMGHSTVEVDARGDIVRTVS
ncbi:MAG: penicillin-binding protein 2, partial [uncultured bacterium]